MTTLRKNEIYKVATIALTADNWCSSCQGALFEQLRRAFPKHLAEIDDIWSRREAIEADYRRREMIAIDRDEYDPPKVWER